MAHLSKLEMFCGYQLILRICDIITNAFQFNFDRNLTNINHILIIYIVSLLSYISRLKGNENPICDITSVLP